jgi:hypothetical protein
MSGKILQRRELCELLECTRTSLMNWRREGAPIRKDLSADPIELSAWYIADRPIFALSIQVALRRQLYRAVGLRLLAERKAERQTSRR